MGLAIAALLLVATAVVGCLLCRRNGKLSTTHENGSQRTDRDTLEEPFIVGSPDDSNLNSIVSQTPSRTASDVTTHTTATDEQSTDLSEVKPTSSSFRKGKMVGAGAFGRVFVGLDEASGRMVAAKEISFEDVGGDGTERRLTLLKKEIAMMKRLKHRNIVRYLGADRSGASDFMIFMEYVSGGSLRCVLDSYGALPPKVASAYTKQALSGLAYLHEMRICHRDLKAANMLLDTNGTVKLADLGAAQNYDTVQSMKGTPYWMAPEVVRNDNPGWEADIWALGCTVIEMITGKFPFEWFGNSYAVMHAIAEAGGDDQNDGDSDSGSSDIVAHLRLPNSLRQHLPSFDFICRCLTKRRHRATAEALLNHPWILYPGGDGSTTGLSSSAVSEGSAPSVSGGDQSSRGCPSSSSGVGSTISGSGASSTPTRDKRRPCSSPQEVRGAEAEEDPQEMTTFRLGTGTS